MFQVMVKPLLLYSAFWVEIAVSVPGYFLPDLLGAEVSIGIGADERSGGGPLLSQDSF